MVNVILLLVNLIALLVALGERSSALGDGLNWLYATDLAQTAPQFWAITRGETVSSTAVLIAWSILSGAWAVATVIDLVVRGRRSTRPTSDPLYPDRADEPRIGAHGHAVADSLQTATAKTSGGPGLGAGGVAAGFAGAMASAQAAQMGQQPPAHGLDASALSDPSLGPLLSDLEKEVSSLPAEAQQEIDQLRRALEALVAKP